MSPPADPSHASLALILWSVRLSLLGYLLSLTLRFGPGTPATRRLARALWTLALLAFLVHLWGAFEYVHHWSHSHAYADTARQTAARVGLNWGGGVYFNYLFLFVWSVDLLWWWCRPHSYEHRPAWAEYTVQGFLAFIAFHATVTFGHGLLPLWGLAGTGWLIFLWIRRRRGLSPAPHRGPV